MWKSYIVTEDGFLRATRDPDDTDAEGFPTFTFQSSRHQAEELNAWFVIMNAGIEFERFRDNYGLETLHSSMAEIATQTLEIVNLIYKRITPSTVYLRSRGSPKKRGVNYSEEGGIGMTIVERMVALRASRIKNVGCLPNHIKHLTFSTPSLV
jgi:hypothetical protein